MTLAHFLIGTSFALGLMLLVTSIKAARVSLENSIAPYLGLPRSIEVSQLGFLKFLQKYLASGNSAPWASDQRIVTELRKCASDQTLIGFRIEQLTFAVGGALLVSLWIALRLATGHEISPAVGLLLVLSAFVGGGGFRSWLLKETSRKRIKSIEEQLPAVLDLLAFAVSAGEPIITALQRVAKTCSGELSVEIKRLISGISVGDNFLGSLDRLQRELDSQPLSRAFRAVIMAIERGTPISEVLRAQAMDSRNHEARKLMTIAGKKETLMMIPVVFLILPMIVIVALYPGLMALKTF